MSLNILLALEGDVGAFGETVRKLVDRGELAPIALQEATADLALRRLEINRAREALLLARDDLANALGIEVGDDFELPTARGEMPRVTAIPSERAIEKSFADLALAKRADLESLRQIAQSEDIRRSEARDALRPKLDFLLDQSSVSLRFAKSLNANLEKGALGTRAVAVHLAQLDLELLRREIRSQVGLVINRLTHSGENYGLAAETYWLLRSVADDKRRQVDFGASQRRDHIAALDKLARIHRQVVDTNLRYAVGLSELRLITGTITVDGSQPIAAIAREFLTLPATP
jgi:outer membrane protein TolC